MSLCTRVEINGEVLDVQPEHDAHRRQMVDELNGQGFRVIALAYKEMPGSSNEPVYAVKDESDLILLGFLAFLDPPKETAAETLQKLHGLKVDVKILTGDNEIITAFICREVGISVDSAFLPFLPMLPIQVLTNNLLYDFSQTTIPTDQVDADWLTVSPLAGTLGFVTLPPLYWLLLAIMLPCYVILTQVVKTWYYRKDGD